MAKLIRLAQTEDRILAAFLNAMDCECQTKLAVALSEVLREYEGEVAQEIGDGMDA